MTASMEQALKKYEQGFRKFPRVLAREMRSALERSGQRWHRDMLKRFGGKAAIFPRRKLLNKLSTRTGKLRRSLRVEMGPKKGTEVSMTLASRGTPYGAAQELGAVIKPVNAKWLWIPLKGNVTPTGRTRKTPRLLMNQKENLYFHKVKGKQAMVVYQTHKWYNGNRRSGSQERRGLRQMTAMFYLKKKVTIPGPETTGGKSRFGFFDTWNRPATARKRRQEFAQAVWVAGRTVVKKSAEGAA